MGGRREPARPSSAFGDDPVPPLQHFSTETADQLLAARVTDGITSELARIGGVGVVSRTTALRAVAEGPTLRDVAKALGVDVVVEGSVIADDDGVHVDVRLVDTIVDRKTWGGRYPRSKAISGRCNSRLQLASRQPLWRRGSADALKFTIYNCKL